MTHVITLIAPTGTLRDLSALVSPLASAGVYFSRIDWLAAHTACDLFLDIPPPPLAFAEFTARCEQSRTDQVLQPTAHRTKRLLISDMDSTMIEQECIDELAECVGLKAHVSAITARAMHGELDFAEALRARVALLKDIPETELERVFAQRITLMPGARTLVQTMKARGAYSILVSGGFRFFTSRVAAALGFDAHEANRLEVAEGKLTGTVAEPILGKEAKHATLLRIAAQRGISIAETLAVGDGANDLPMLQAAGLGIAYHAKPMVIRETAAAIRFQDLSALLYVQGIPPEQWCTT